MNSYFNKKAIWCDHCKSPTLAYQEEFENPETCMSEYYWRCSNCLGKVKESTKKRLEEMGMKL